MGKRALFATPILFLLSCSGNTAAPSPDSGAESSALGLSSPSSGNGISSSDLNPWSSSLEGTSSQSGFSAGLSLAIESSSSALTLSSALGSSSTTDVSSSSEAAVSSSAPLSSSSEAPLSSSWMDPCAGVTLAANQFCDSRDGEVYRTTKSGPWSDSQTWMAENLRFDAKTQGNCGSATSQVACMSICYSNIPANCENKYGRLYDYATALQIATAYNAVTLTRTSILQGICPEGWHLPSANEWSDLVRRTGQWYSTYDAYTIAKAFKASTGWNTSVGDDVFAFTALPAGTSYWVQIGGSGYGMQVGRGTKAYFLALDGDEADMMTAYIFSDDNNQIVHSLGYMQPKEYGVSVRCVRDTL